MCGITGFWRSGPSSADELSELVGRMADTLKHRGPDDSGNWVNPEQGVALGFRRLAIIDLSPRGHQPMASSTGRYQVVFNGEIYNHVELAEELSSLGHRFRGHSDTEVVLAAFEEWGPEEAVARFVGMFSIGLWDRDRAALWLLRDRLGIKPMFVFRARGLVAFASELKAFSSLPGFSGEVDPEALAAYFRYLYVPAPACIYKGVKKLLPGHFLEIRDPEVDLPDPVPYWNLAEIARAGRRDPFPGSTEEAVDALESILTDAVRLRMRSDVPLGAFLSGGVDSSTVVSLMQEISPQPIRTFTVGFEQKEHDESSEAGAIANHLGTTHTVLRLGDSDALGLIDGLPEMFDEPLADPSQLPTFLICRAARREVTVAISGDGGDEVFCGYNRYDYGARLIDRLGGTSPHLRCLLGGALKAVPVRIWDQLGGALSGLGGPSPRLLGEKLHKIGDLVEYSTAEGMYRSLVSAWQTPPVPPHDGDDDRAATALRDPSFTLLERMMLADQHSYLPDDLLAKVDRASMAVSLEVRVPILDHRVCEFSWRLPDNLKLRDGTPKWILRQVLERRVPPELFERPKVGFSVPLAAWLRGPLLEWAEDLLAPACLAQDALLDVGYIRDTWSDFKKGRNNAHLAIWAVLMFQAWRQRWSRSSEYLAMEMAE